MAYDDRITYTVIIDFTQDVESDVHYAELKAEISKRLSEVAPTSKGMAVAHFFSISAA